MIAVADLLRYQLAEEKLEEKAATLTRLGEKLLAQGSLRGVTALKTAEAIRSELLLDSLAGCLSLPRTAGAKVCDIGTGGGVPGLVLAIARPDLRFTLTDSAARKTRWVQECVDELGLTNVRIVTSRLELLGRDEGFRERFDVVTAKALATVAVLVEFSMPLLKVGGKLVAYKGPALDDELLQARQALRCLGAKVLRKRAYELEAKSYRILEVEKIKPTASPYPRRDGIPQKTPL